MAADINTQLQNITTDVTAISNLVNRLVTIFSGGGVQNPDIAVAKAELQAYASNANNISAGVLATANGGTGRTDGMVTDVYLERYQSSAVAKGLLGSLRLSVGNDLNEIFDDGSYFLYKPNAVSADDQFASHYPFYSSFGAMVVYRDPTSNSNRTIQQFVLGSSICSRLNASGNKNEWGVWSAIRGMKNELVIFVSKTGDDRNTGFDSPVNAIATIERLYDILSGLIHAGRVTIQFGEGEWGSVTIVGYNAPISIKGEDNKNVVFEDIILYNGDYDINTVSVHSITAYNSRVSHGDITYVQGASSNHWCLSIYDSYVYLNAAIKFANNLSCFGFLNCRNSRVETGPSVSTSGTNPGYSVYFGASEFHKRGASGVFGSLEDLPGNLGIQYMSGFSYGHLISDCSVNFLPISNNSLTLGDGSHHWADVYYGNTAISLSDERLKTNIVDIPDSFFDKWENVRFVLFQFNDAIAKKGSAARLHSGVIAQQVKAILGNDAFRYGLLCYDEWKAKDWDEVVVDSDAVYEEVRVVDNSPEGFHTERKLITPEKTHVEHHHEDGGNVYSIRYAELLCVEAEYQRRKVAKLEARLAALEVKVK